MKFNKVIFVLSCSIIFLFTLYFIILPKVIEKEEVVLPNLCDKALDEALVTLDELNLDYNIIVSLESDCKMVLNTIPMAFSTVKENSIINLYISDIIKFSMPDFKLLDYNENIERLNKICTEQQLQLIIKYEDNNNYLSGLIINQIIEDDKFYITVSKCDNILLMPDLLYKNMYEAAKIMSNFNLNIIYKFEESFIPRNQVISQSVKPSTIIFKENNSEIVIYISK